MQPLQASPRAHNHLTMPIMGNNTSPLFPPPFSTAPFHGQVIDMMDAVILSQ